MTTSNDPSEFRNLNLDPLLSVNEAADYLSVKKTTMYGFVKRHEIPVFRITSDTKIRKSDLDRFIDDREVLE